MRLFSILQTALAVPYINKEGETEFVGLAFSEDPEDSSQVRLRVEPANSTTAVEITFDRNGRERSRVQQPSRFPAWDRREPSVINAELAKNDAASEAEPVDAGDKKGKKGK